MYIMYQHLYGIIVQKYICYNIAIHSRRSLLVIRFDSQRRQSFLIWLRRAIHPSQVLAVYPLCVRTRHMQSKYPPMPLRKEYPISAGIGIGRGWSTMANAVL